MRQTHLDAASKMLSRARDKDLPASMKRDHSTVVLLIAGEPRLRLIDVNLTDIERVTSLVSSHNDLVGAIA
jgi:hypothetical protein